MFLQCCTRLRPFALTFCRYRETGPEGLASRLSSSDFKATGELEFLNDWSYGLGKEILTPFGRQQLCKYHVLVPVRARGDQQHTDILGAVNLGVFARIKYGFLLDAFEDRVPVLRTESQE
jgi:hypothetical protein